MSEMRLEDTALYAASTVLHGLADEIKWQMSVLARLGVPVDRLAEISPGAVGLHGLCERIANAADTIQEQIALLDKHWKLVKREEERQGG